MEKPPKCGDFLVYSPSLLKEAGQRLSIPTAPMTDEEFEKDQKIASIEAKNCH